MPTQQRLNQNQSEYVTYGCLIVSLVFFLVLSQFIILRLPGIVTQVFRPIIVVILFIQMQKRGAVFFNAGRIAAVAGIYAGLIILLNTISSESISAGVSTSLYFLMFFVITGTPWSKKELRIIIFSVFAGAFACAVAMMLSNDMTDFNVGASGGVELLGMTVNRNKNAYAFAVGTIIGMIYLFKGKNIPKIITMIMLAVIGYCLMYSQCRGAFFCTIAAVCVMVGLSLLKIWSHDQGKALAYGILFILFCILSYYILKNSALSRLVDGESTSGRDGGIEYAFTLFKGSGVFEQIFGSGYMFEAENTTVRSHFVFTDYLLSMGIIGASLTVFMFIGACKHIKGRYSYAFFAIAALRCFFELLDYYIYIPLMLSVIIYHYSNGNDNESIKLFSRRI